MTILTASTAEQYAMEVEGGGAGVFTSLFVDALGGERPAAQVPDACRGSAALGRVHQIANRLDAGHQVRAAEVEGHQVGLLARGDGAGLLVQPERLGAAHGGPVDGIARERGVLGLGGPLALVPERAVVQLALVQEGVAGLLPLSVSGEGEARTIAVTMPAVAALSAFTHHVMVTAMMLPILLRHARERRLPASRLLMPMSLAASLGTTLTLVSAPAFLLANDQLKRAGAEGLGIFSITPIGIALVVVGTVYMLLTRWILPKRSGEGGEDDYLRLGRYRTELLVVPGGQWATRSLADMQKAIGKSVTVHGWLREGQRRDDLTANSPLLGGVIKQLAKGDAGHSDCLLTISAQEPVARRHSVKCAAKTAIFSPSRRFKVSICPGMLHSST